MKSENLQSFKCKIVWLKKWKESIVSILSLSYRSVKNIILLSYSDFQLSLK